LEQKPSLSKKKREYKRIKAEEGMAMNDAKRGSARGAL